MLQTGANTQEGGLNQGFRSERYQELLALAPEMEPIVAAKDVALRNPASANSDALVTAFRKRTSPAAEVSLSSLWVRDGGVTGPLGLGCAPASTYANLSELR